VLSSSEDVRERSSLLNALRKLLSGVSDLFVKIGGMVGIRWRKSRRESASKEAWGAQGTLARSDVLSLEHDMSTEGMLVSKPVLLG
jgi:hypothetical protein